MSDTDPLHGARLRQERALEHLADIRVAVQAIYDGLQQVISYEDPETGQLIVRIGRKDQPDQPPSSLSVRVGEMIYNLRAALDYVVYELARHDSGAPQKGTQFPIEDCQKVFRARRRPAYLKGVRKEHVALIESYQPYKGCSWTRLLRTLSNPDKHRELHVLFTQTESNIEGRVTTMLDVEDVDRLDRFYAAKGKADGIFHVGKSRQMDVNLQLTADVTFRDGPSVVETLEELETEVRALIERFRQEFT